MQLCIKFILTITGEPTDDLIHFGFRAPLFLGFGDVVGIDADNACSIDSMVCHDGSVFLSIFCLSMIFKNRYHGFVATLTGMVKGCHTIAIRQIDIGSRINQ